MLLHDLEHEGPAPRNTRALAVRLPGAKANMAKHSPVEATAVTTERLLSKYCDRMVTVGRKLKQNPRPVMGRSETVRTTCRLMPERCVQSAGIWALILEMITFGEPRNSFWSKAKQVSSEVWKNCKSCFGKLVVRKKKKGTEKSVSWNFFSYFSAVFPPDLYNSQCTELLSNIVFT